MAKALGRGLGALLPGASSREEAPAPVVSLPWSSLRPNPRQPRRDMDPEGLESLARSLERHGLLEPILVRPVEGGYEIIAGERRWQAAKRAGLESVPVRVLDIGDDDLLEVALVENLQREDLTPIEVARALSALVETTRSQEEAARQLGWNRSTVTNKLRLLQLPEEVQAMLSRRELTEGHGRTLLAVEGQEKRITLAERCRDGGWSVRELERALSKVPKEPRREASAGEGTTYPEVERLQRRFGLALRVVTKGRRRSLRIDGLGERAMRELLALLDREGESLFPGE